MKFTKYSVLVHGKYQYHQAIPKVRYIECVRRENFIILRKEGQKGLK